MRAKKKHSVIPFSPRRGMYAQKKRISMGPEQRRGKERGGEGRRGEGRGGRGREARGGEGREGEGALCCSQTDLRGSLLTLAVCQKPSAVDVQCQV